MNVCIIPARGGSVRIPQKNIRPFHGKPIIAYSIEAAKASCLFDLIVVSTDDKNIGRIAKRYGADEIHYRTGWYAGPHCGTQEVVYEWVFTQVRGDLVDCDVCCIYPTSPLLLPDDLRIAHERFKAEDDAGVGVFVMAVGADPLRDAGAFYWGSCNDFGSKRLIGAHTRLYVLPEHRACDINTEEDWLRAEKMYAALHGIKT